MTYDGRREKENVTFYVGSEAAEVLVDGAVSTESGPIGQASVDKLVIGAMNEKGDRPFCGMLDSLRIYASSGPDTSALLTEAQLEAIRREDLGLGTELPPSSRAYLEGKWTPAPGAGTDFAAARIEVMDRIFPDRPVPPSKNN